MHFTVTTLWFLNCCIFAGTGQSGKTDLDPVDGSVGRGGGCCFTNCTPEQKYT